MIEISTLQLVGGITVLLSSGILIGAIIGYTTPRIGDKNE